MRRLRRPPAAMGPSGYQELVEIAGGPFASVYRATETDTSRPVALKMLAVETVHPRLVEAFKQEIRGLIVVSGHPNIVTLHRLVVTPDGRPVLVLELCRESAAQQLHREGSLGAPAVAAMGIKVCGALETAHRAGFLHRDIKPQNVLFTQFGEPALADFGIAALQAAAQGRQGAFGFTTLHAPPELLEGQPLSPASDVYALASTLYQLLGGQAPFLAFEGEAPASVVLRVLHAPVPPLQAPGVPLALSDVIERALTKDPAERPPSAAAFADALRAVEVSEGWETTPYVMWGDPSAGAWVQPPAASPAVSPSPWTLATRSPNAGSWGASAEGAAAPPGEAPPGEAPPGEAPPGEAPPGEAPHRAALVPPGPSVVVPPGRGRRELPWIASRPVPLSEMRPVVPAPVSGATHGAEVPDVVAAAAEFSPADPSTQPPPVAGPLEPPPKSKWHAWRTRPSPDPWPPPQWQDPVQWKGSAQWQGPVQWQGPAQWKGPLQHAPRAAEPQPGPESARGPLPDHWVTPEGVDPTVEPPSDLPVPGASPVPPVRAAPPGAAVPEHWKPAEPRDPAAGSTRPDEPPGSPPG